jgi:hypothetical protein
MCPPRWAPSSRRWVPGSSAPHVQQIGYPAAIGTTASTGSITKAWPRQLQIEGHRHKRDALLALGGLTQGLGAIQAGGVGCAVQIGTAREVAAPAEGSGDQVVLLIGDVQGVVAATGSAPMEAADDAATHAVIEGQGAFRHRVGAPGRIRFPNPQAGVLAEGALAALGHHLEFAGQPRLAELAVALHPPLERHPQLGAGAPPAAPHCAPCGWGCWRSPWRG